MMKSAAVILVFVCVAGCATSSHQTMVLDYADFGPQAAAWETIGMDWWQWKSCGGHCMGTDHRPVRVVVYHNIPLPEVKKAYPVVEEEGQDYRYLSYPKAMAYLNGQIQEDHPPELIKAFRNTKSRIEEKLGKPNKPIAGD